MAATYRNRLVTAISNTPGSTGALTIAAAASGYRTFGAADDGLSFDVSIAEYAGAIVIAWEIRTGCVYTHTGTSLARGTLEDSSTGSAIALTSAAVVTVTMSAGMGNKIAHAVEGYISGMQLSYSSSSAVSVSAGRIGIDGLQYDFAGATYTSGTTMKDMANSTVTLGASKGYFVFAYNNAGTIEIRFEDFDGTGDGAVPTFDADLDYWHATTTGVQARRIGKIWTTSGSAVIDFVALGRGRFRKLWLKWANNSFLVNNSTAGTAAYQSITTTPYVSADDDAIWLEAAAKRTTGTGTARILVSVNATNEYLNLTVQNQDVNSVALGRAAVPNTGAMHYMTVTDVGGTLKFAGTEFYA